MKLMMSLLLLIVSSQIAMEAPEIQNITAEHGEERFNPPSLRFLAFRAVEQNMHRIGWKAEKMSQIILDVMHAQEVPLDLFDKARIVDNFKLQELFVPVAKELASYIDAHAGSNERKSALAELQKLSASMQRAVSEHRKN